MVPWAVTAEELSIEKMIYGGDGLARSEGRIVMLPYVLAGERVNAEIGQIKPGLFRGTLKQVLDPSAFRVEAPCPYFGKCGGCHYQHATYEHQLAIKVEVVREALRRVGKIEFSGEIQVLAGEPWQYRNRAQLHIRAGRIGYFSAGSHQLVPVDRCPISSPKLNETIATLARELPRYRHFEASIELFTNESEVQLGYHDPVPAAVRSFFASLGPAGPIEYAGFRVSANSFFQVNRFLVDQLVEAAVVDATGDSALDLYAGVGLFTKALATKFARVIAVESGASAFRDLEFNVQRGGWAAMAARNTTEEYLSAIEATPDFVLADPPRTGLGPHSTKTLVRLKPPAITIVSCDPATLSRDLKPMLEAGYRIEQLTLIDLFPQTFHLETITRLRLA